MKKDRPSVTVSASTATSVLVTIGNIYIIATDLGEDGINLQVQANGQKVTVSP